MEKPNIVQVNPADVFELQKIGRDTFFETFSAENDPSDMSKYLEVGFSIKKLSSELKNPDSLFYFAKLDGYVIGYLKINFGLSQTELKNEASLEIERIYVLSQYHGKQMGQSLFEKAIQIAKEKNVNYVWLGVWEKNVRAINFYKKNGFVEFDKHLFILGNDEQTDIMMKLNMKY